MRRNALSYKTDEELARLALQDEAALYELFQRYEAKLLRYLKRLLNVSHETCEDLLQEVFIKVYRNLNSFDSKLKFSSWIYRITRNEAISHYRKYKKNMQELSLEDGTNDYLALLKDDTDLRKELEAKELGELVHKTLLRLPRKYREVLILKYLEEKDYQEMSGILKKPVGTIGTLLNRAKRAFKNELNNKLVS